MKWLIAIITTVALASCSSRIEPLWVFQANQPITAAAVIGDSKQLAILTGRDISILNAETGQEIRKIRGADVDIYAIACTSTACWIGGGQHEKGYLGNVDVNSGEIKRITASENFTSINAVAIGPDRNLATGHADETAILWDEKNTQQKKRLVVQDGLEIHAMGFVDRNLAIGNNRGELVLWDGLSDSPTQRIKLESSAILSIVFASGRLFAGGWQYLDVFDPKHLSEKQQIKIDRAAVLSCDATPDGQSVWCGLSDGSLSRIEMNGSRKTALKIHGDEIRFVKVIDGVVITASKDKTVKAWKLSQMVERSSK